MSQSRLHTTAAVQAALGLVGQTVQRQRAALHRRWGTVVAVGVVVIAVVAAWWSLPGYRPRSAPPTAEAYAVQAVTDGLAAGVTRAWRITLPGDDAFPRWRPADTESLLTLARDATYRLRAEWSLPGTLECRYRSADDPKKVTEAHPVALDPADRDGLPILPEARARLEMRWLPAEGDAAAFLLLEELAAPPAEYAAYLERASFKVLPVPFDP